METRCVCVCVCVRVRVERERERDGETLHNRYSILLFIYRSYICMCNHVGIIRKHLYMGLYIHVDTGWRRETGKFEIIRKKRRKLTKLYLILKMCSMYKSGNFVRHHFLKITSVKCCPFRCTHSVSRF
jgi:hypothetical protein